MKAHLRLSAQHVGQADLDPPLPKSRLGFLVGDLHALFPSAEDHVVSTSAGLHPPPHFDPSSGEGALLDLAGRQLVDDYDDRLADTDLELDVRPIELEARLVPVGVHLELEPQQPVESRLAARAAHHKILNAPQYPAHRCGCRKLGRTRRGSACCAASASRGRGRWPGWS